MDQMLCASRGCLAPRAIAYRGGFRKLRTILTPNGDLGKPRAWRTQRVDVQQGRPSYGGARLTFGLPNCRTNSKTRRMVMPRAARGPGLV
jgi:hypothetical protein